MESTPAALQWCLQDAKPAAPSCRANLQCTAAKRRNGNRRLGKLVWRLAKQQEKLLRGLAADQAKHQEELLLTHLPEALGPVLREEVTAKVVQQLKEQAEQQQEKEKQEETAQYLAARVLVVGCITTSMLIFKAELLEPNLAAAIVVPTIFKLVDSASKAAVKAPFQLPSKE